jgi:serine/threonine-protein kinase HipA
LEEFEKKETYWGEHTTSVNGKGKRIADADLIKVGMDAGIKKTNCTDMIDSIRKQTRDLIDMRQECQNQKN